MAANSELTLQGQQLIFIRIKANVNDPEVLLKAECEAEILAPFLVGFMNCATVNRKQGLGRAEVHTFFTLFKWGKRIN